MNNFNYVNLTPFKWYVRENFPFIEAEFDAMTNWDLFCKLGKEINKIIDSQNLVGEQAENLTNAFNTLKDYVDNYFDNLDVQEEINNKLDKMVEDGTFTDLLRPLIEDLKVKTNKKIYYFNTVADMKADTSLMAGDAAQTLGYYAADDGGQGLYQIVDDNTLVDDGGSVHDLANGLKAKLVIDDFVNVKQCGAKGDGITDDTTAIQNAFNLNIPVYFPKSSGAYMISSYLSVNSSIKMDNYIKILLPDEISDNHSKQVFRINNYQEEKPLIIENPLIDGSWDSINTDGEWGHGIAILGSKNVIVKDGHIKNCKGDGICLGESYPEQTNKFSENIKIDKTYIENCRRCSISIISVKKAKITNVTAIKNNDYVAMFDFESNRNNDLIINDIIIDKAIVYSKGNIFNFYPVEPISNITIQNCEVYCSTKGIVMLKKTSYNDADVDNVKILNNNFYNWDENAISNLIYCGRCKNLFIEGNYFNGNADILVNTYSSDTENVICQNNDFTNLKNISTGINILANNIAIVKNNKVDCYAYTSSYNSTITVSAKIIDIVNNLINHYQYGIAINDKLISNIESINISDNIFLNGAPESTNYRSLIFNGAATVKNLKINNNIYNNANTRVYYKSGNFNLPFVPYGLSNKEIIVSNFTDLPSENIQAGTIAISTTISSNSPVGYIFDGTNWKSLANVQ